MLPQHTDHQIQPLIVSKDCESNRLQLTIRETEQNLNQANFKQALMNVDKIRKQHEELDKKIQRLENENAENRMVLEEMKRENGEIGKQVELRLSRKIAMS